MYKKLQNYIGQRETAPIESKQQSVMTHAMPNLIERRFSKNLSQEISRIRKKSGLPDGPYHKNPPVEGGGKKIRQKSLC